MEKNSKLIGFYRDEETNESHEVYERTTQVKHLGKSLDGSIDYITRKGIDLNPLDDDCQRFEMIQTDGIIVKIPE